jgi:multidrug efflux pump subunit AcrA (membrane-fusion protein)
MYTEIDLPNPGGLLRPGMYGVARIMLGTDPKAATLPAGCLVGESNGEKAEVYVVKGGKAHKVSIGIGADDGLRVEVLDGLSPDDEVIVGATSLREGTPVRPVQSARPLP